MKPSPVASILLFIGTAALLFGLLSRTWSSAGGEGFSVKSGPVWGEVCMSRNLDSDSDMECKTHTFLTGEGGWGIGRVLGVLFVLFGLGGAVVGGIAGVSLLSKPRSALSLVTLILVGAGFLIMLGLLLYGLAKSSKFNLPEYGFFIWLLGSILSIVGAIMAMARAGGPAAAGMPMGRPPHWAPQQPYGPGAGYQGGYAPPGGYGPQGAPGGYGPPGAPGAPYPQGAPGYPGSGAPAGGAPGSGGYPGGTPGAGSGGYPQGPGGYPQGGAPGPGGYPPQQPQSVASQPMQPQSAQQSQPMQPQSAQQSQPMQPQSVASQPMQPQSAQQSQPMQPAAQAGPPHPACGTPATWVAQYNRWFCTRCNQYL